jgi:hypothetical protein
MMTTGNDLPAETEDSFDLGSAYKHWPVWLTVYATASGAIYQHAFWSQFHISITQYMGLQDLVRISLMPLMVFIALISVALAVQIFVMEWWLGSSKVARDPGAPVRQPRRRHHSGVPLALTMLVLIILISLLVWNWDKYMTAVSVGVVGLFICFILARRSSVLHKMGSRFARDLLLAAIAALPLSYTLGKTAAWVILDGESYVAASLIEQDQAHIFRGNSPEPIKFLGHIGQYDFFYQSKSTFIVRSSELHAFAVSHAGAAKKIRVPLIGP